MTAIDDAPSSLYGLVRSGGNPYILLVVTDPDTGQVAVESAGIPAEKIIAGLRQVADLLETEA